MEIPALEARQDKFRAAKTVTLGISVDSIFSHANWGASVGGVSFPLLADFHPKGAVAQSFGLYNEERGITFRATVIIDAGGTIRHIEQVASGRDMDALAEKCAAINAEHGAGAQGQPPAPGVSGDNVLYVRNGCGPSRSVMLARENLHLQDAVKLVNVSEKPQELGRLKDATGAEQVPCLIRDGKPMLEAADIVKHLSAQATGM